MRVVVDTSGWYAFVVEKDKHHRRAVGFLKKEEHQLILCVPVFTEVIALIHARQGKSLAVESGQELRGLGLTRLSQGDEKGAWGLFEETGMRVSFVDCVVTILAKRRKLPVFGFDGHFSKLGMTVVP